MEAISEIIKTRISTIFLRKDDILQLDIESDQYFDVNDCHELINAAEKIGNGKRFLNLIIVGNHTLPDHDARVLSCSEEGSRYKSADAFVIHSLAQSIIANFYMKINKPFVPTRFFRNADEAVKWLEQFKE